MTSQFGLVAFSFVLGISAVLQSADIGAFSLLLSNSDLSAPTEFVIAIRKFQRRPEIAGISCALQEQRQKNNGRDVRMSIASYCDLIL